MKLLFLLTALICISRLDEIQVEAQVPFPPPAPPRLDWSACKSSSFLATPACTNVYVQACGNYGAINQGAQSSSGGTYSDFLALACFEFPRLFDVSITSGQNRACLTSHSRPLQYLNCGRWVRSLCQLVLPGSGGFVAEVIESRGILKIGCKDLRAYNEVNFASLQKLDKDCNYDSVHTLQCSRAAYIFCKTKFPGTVGKIQEVSASNPAAVMVACWIPSGILELYV